MNPEQIDQKNAHSLMQTFSAVAVYMSSLWWEIETCLENIPEKHLSWVQMKRMMQEVHCGHFFICL